MKEFIVKVQLPLFSSDGNAGVLVYNEDQSILQELPIRSVREVKELKRQMDGESKGYFWARIEDDGKGLILTRPAPWQQW